MTSSQTNPSYYLLRQILQYLTLCNEKLTSVVWFSEVVLRCLQYAHVKQATVCSFRFTGSWLPFLLLLSLLWFWLPDWDQLLFPCTCGLAQNAPCWYQTKVGIQLNTAHCKKTFKTILIIDLKIAQYKVNRIRWPAAWISSFSQLMKD